MAADGRSRDLGEHKKMYFQLAGHLMILHHEAKTVRERLELAACKNIEPNDFSMNLACILDTTNKASETVKDLNEKLDALKTKMNFYEDAHPSAYPKSGIQVIDLKQALEDCRQS